MRVLITGSSGFLGHTLTHQAILLNHHTLALSYQNSLNMPKAHHFSVDLSDKAALDKVFKSQNPQAVIHCAALARVDDCERHPELSDKVNVSASEHLAKLCHEMGAKLIFCSTDLVFDGLKPPYRPEDPPSPICRYGADKAKAEAKVLEMCPKATVCRLPLMFGKGPEGRKVFFETMLEKLQLGQEVKLFYDEYRTPLSSLEVANWLLWLLDQEYLPAIIHLAGDERLSRYDFGLKVARHYGLAESLLVATSSKDSPTLAKRPADVSLDSSKAKALGFEPLSLLSQLEKLPYLTHL
ncbi:MAG: SDR family oxidoreductase [Deinococcales bacterium]